MTDNDVFKKRVRDRMERTGEPFAQARTMLADYPLPTLAELDAADEIDWHGEYEPPLGTPPGEVPPVYLRRHLAIYGYNRDCYRYSVPDLFGPNPGPNGEMALIARMGIHDGLPVLVIESVETTVDHGKIPGAWWTSYGLDLYERGWAYNSEGRTNSVGTNTLKWRVEITVVPDRPADAARVRVHDGIGGVLFDGPALLAPGWLVRARVDPVGLLVVSGPVSGSLVPDVVDDKNIEDMLGTADLVAARIRVEFL